MAPRPLEYLFGLEQFGIKFGLDNIRTLVEALGHPDRSYRVVHIAGTNGKGSVTAMVDAALRAAGYRTGRYTSPHMVDVTERFVIDGTPVTTIRLEEAADDLQRTVQALLIAGRLQAHPTFFEATTALALRLFADARVEVAVCEVGLGGRLDATNVLSPVVTAITSIGLDHQQHLGTTLAEIAREKAGILKPGVPVVIGTLPAEAEDVVRRVAADKGAPLATAEDVTVDDVHLEQWGTRVRLRTPRHDYGMLAIGLAGKHQVGNAAVAVRLLEILDESGIHVSPDATRHGLSDVRWPGRLERRVLSEGRQVLFDAAHNPEGAQALAAFLDTQGSIAPALVFAAMRDKDVREMILALAPSVSALVLTRASSPRSADPADLADLARSLGLACPIVVEPALDKALEAAWAVTPTIVVAGSIFLLGDVMKLPGWS